MGYCEEVNGGWAWRATRLPRIPDIFLQCSVYLYPSEDDAKKGEPVGGSGFVVGVPCGTPEPLAPTLEESFRFTGDWPESEYDYLSRRSGPFHHYVVTNRHVIDDRDGMGGSTVIRFNTFSNGIATLVTEHRHWVHHPESDVAVYHLKIHDNMPYSFALLPLPLIMSEEDAESLDVGIGDDLFSIGRFISSEGVQKNAPVARFGHVSGWRWIEPIPEKGYPGQPSFLAEFHTVPGYSGAPVFLRVPVWELLHSHSPLRKSLGESVEKFAFRKDRSLMRLLGITWSYLQAPDLALSNDDIGEIEGFRVEGANSGMMAAVPAWKLLELLNQPELRKMREKERAKKWPSVPL